MDRKELAGFERKVKDTIKSYKLLSKRDKVLVAYSGGKDSTSVLYLLNKWGYNVEALAIDLHIGDYSKRNIENVKRFCKEQKIRLNLVDLRDEFGSSICYIRGGIQEKRRLSNCTICGVMKRWILNRKAKELRATKLATGHNLNDESETVIMNILKGNPELGIGMGPKSGFRKDALFVERIKPLYFCTNAETRAYSEAMGFPVVYEPCPCSEGVFRRRIRKELVELEKAYPDIRMNLVQNFLELLPGMRRKYFDGGAISRCEICGEPSRNQVCQLCGFIRLLKSK